VARPKKKKLPKINNTTKKYFIAIFFIFVWVMSLLKYTDWWLIGVTIQDFLFYLLWEYYKIIFIPVAFLLPIFLIKEKDYEFGLYRIIWLLIYLISFTSLIWHFGDSGWVFNLDSSLITLFWNIWIVLFFVVLFILSLVILFQFSPIFFTRKVLWTWLDIASNLKKDTWKTLIKTVNNNKTIKEKKIDKKKQELEDMMLKLKQEKEALKKEKKVNQLKLSDVPKKIKIEKKAPWKITNIFTKKNNTEKVKITTNPEFKNWEYPNIELLDNKGWNIVYDKNEIRRKEIEIEEKLLQFKIQVTMEGFQVGPTVIQYRLKPKSWIKLQKIVNLKDDLTLALKAKNIRIQAPIPWLWVVWIEVPNNNRQIVWLREIIESREFNSKKYEIPIALWKNVNWDLIVWDLCRMPHLLVAWQTGSWKSVWMNGFLVSMLYKFSPSELKMIMVDPKRVELSVYNWIPHLLTPVITSPDKALNALKWCVAEMLRRYDLAVWLKARNLAEYNAKVPKKEKLPYIVMVVDELADLMMSGNKKEVENSIARVAQMARAVWMHLIIATQRPSVDVITWLIKANIPSRIAFTVSSQIDSRTILDKMWAEDLLGRWDMLYYPTWANEPERIQWVFVETSEVEAVVNKIKLTIDPEILQNMQMPEIVNGKSKLEWSILENYKWDQEEDPEIIEKALQVVKESKKWSTSLIQRKLGLWYARAAKVLDILEELWVVWPSNWSKPREVYVD